MEYLKKFLNALKEIIIYEISIIISLFLLGTVILIFNPNINSEILMYLFNRYSFYPIVLITLGLIIIFYKEYLKIIKNNQQLYQKKKTLYYVLLGVSIALIINIIFFMIDKYIIKIYTDISVWKFSIYISIFMTGIIGPIIEEILFRGLLFEKLKKFNSLSQSIIVSTAIFALIHNGFIQTIYAAILGYILICFYNKYKNIFVPMIIHISANVIIVLYQTTIYKLNAIAIILIFLLSLGALFISLKALNVKLMLPKK